MSDDSQPLYLEKYAEYERAWRRHVERVNGDRFLAGMFPARFTQKDKQEFIRTLVVIEASDARLK